MASARVVEAVNAAIRSVLDAVLPRLAPLPSAFVLAALGVVLAVILLLVLRFVSATGQIERARREIAAGLYELRLFSQEPRPLWSAQRALIAAQGRYLRHSALPALFAIPIVAISMTHLEPFFGGRIAAGQRRVVTVVMTPPAIERPALSLRSADDDVLIEDATWLPSQRMMAWNVSAARPGRHLVSLESTNGPNVLSMPFVVGDALVAKPTARSRPGVLRQLLEPGAPPLFEAAQIERIEVSYPPAVVNVFGSAWSWEVVLLLALVVAVLALRRRFRVAL